MICENQFYFDISDVNAPFLNLAADMEQMQALAEIIISDGFVRLGTWCHITIYGALRFFLEHDSQG